MALWLIAGKFYEVFAHQNFWKRFEKYLVLNV